MNLKCIPINLATIMTFNSQPFLPLCNTSLGYSAFSQYIDIFYMATHKCPKSCITNQFTSGMVQTLKGYEITNKHVEIEIDFLTNRLEVHQEYLVYDFEGMIGSIGGTLGLFIGFSLLSTLDWLNGKKNCKLTCNFPVVPSILNDSMYPLSLAAHSRFPVGFIVTAVVLPNILAPQSMLNFPVEMFQTCNTPLDNAHIIKLLFRGRNRQAVTKPPPSKL